MLRGATLFAGDSMTVGLAPFVQVDGVKSTVAASGRTADQLLEALKAFSDLGVSKNVVVLAGANDIGGGQSAERIFATLTAIWNLAKAKGLRVYALTLPPVKGWSGFASNFDAIERKRQALNTLILASPVPDAILNMGVMADPDDPQRLSVAFDSGDHLHPRKDAMGALLTRALEATEVSSDPRPVVASSSLGHQIPLASIALAAAGVSVAILGYRALSPLVTGKRIRA